VSVDVPGRSRRAGSDGPSAAGEHCFDTQFLPGGFNLVFLRAPRPHALSLFLEVRSACPPSTSLTPAQCKYSNWGIKGTRTAPWRNMSDEDGFAYWAHYFATFAPSAEEVAESRSSWQWLPDFGCYNPRNMQTRQLAGGGACVRDPHHLYAANFPPPEGALASARERLAQFHLVGTLEAYDLCFCLLAHRLRLPQPPGCFEAGAPMGGKLVTHRGRNRPQQTFTLAELRQRQGTNRRRPPTELLGPEIGQAAWGDVDAITGDDQVLFVAAMQRLLAEAAAYEAGAGVGGYRRLGAHLLDYGRLLASLGEYFPRPLLRQLPLAFSL